MLLCGQRFVAFVAGGGLRSRTPSVLRRAEDQEVVAAPGDRRWVAARGGSLRDGSSNREISWILYSFISDLYRCRIRIKGDALIFFRIHHAMFIKMDSVGILEKIFRLNLFARQGKPGTTAAKWHWAADGAATLIGSYWWWTMLFSNWTTAIGSWELALGTRLFADFVELHQHGCILTVLLLLLHDWLALICITDIIWYYG